MNNDNAEYNLSDLIYRRINGDPLSSEEEAYLDAWIGKDPENEATYHNLVDEKERSKHFLDLLLHTRKMKEVIQDRLKGSFTNVRKGPNPFWRTLPYWAAAVIGIISMLYWLDFIGPNYKSDSVVKYQPANIQPGGDKAVLTLGDGSKLDLNANDSGLLVRQGKSAVVQQGNGQLSYEKTQHTDAIVYNTISTPRGGQYRVILADGSKVWLNAATRIRFPSSFTGATRTVDLLEGEAYFEVSHDKHMPFVVKVLSPADSKPMEVTVLGTHFNIQAYPFDKTINTTLIEGTVKVNKGKTAAVLFPNMQARTNASDEDVEVLSNINPDTIIDWTQGLFIFRDEKLTTFMRKICMWYDVDVEYVVSPNSNAASRMTGATGTIKRNTSLMEVLRALELAGVKYEIKDRTIKVFL